MDFIIGHPYRAEMWQMISDCMRKEGNLKAAEIAAQRAAERDVHLAKPPN